MILRKALLLAMLLFVMVGSALAEKIENGKVTAIYRGENVIEIDGRKFQCPRRELRHIRKGDQVRFKADYNHDDIKYRRAIIEIESR